MATKKMGSTLRVRRKKQLFKIWGCGPKNDKALCWWCFTVLTHETATIEHLMPRALDGSHDLINLRLACRKCNEGHVNPLDVCHPTCQENKLVG